MEIKNKNYFKEKHEKGELKSKFEMSNKNATPKVGATLGAASELADKKALKEIEEKFTIDCGEDEGFDMSELVDAIGKTKEYIDSISSKSERETERLSGKFEDETERFDIDKLMETADLPKLEIVSVSESKLSAEWYKAFTAAEVVPTSDPVTVLEQAPRNPAEVMAVAEVNIYCAISLIDEFLDIRKYDDNLTWYQRNLLTNSMTRLNNRLLVINGVITKDEFDIFEKQHLKTLDNLIKHRE